MQGLPFVLLIYLSYVQCRSLEAAMPIQNDLEHILGNHVKREEAKPLPECKTTPTSTWKAGDCSLTTITRPPTKTVCHSTTQTPATYTGCMCPDDNLWNKLSGGDGNPCNGYDGTQENDLKAAVWSCTTSAEETCTFPTSSVASGPGGKYDVTVTYPTLCQTESITFSTSKELPTGMIYIEPHEFSWDDAKEGWKFFVGGGASLTSLKSVTVPDTSGQGDPPPDYDYKHNDDGSWSMQAPEGSTDMQLVAAMEDKDSTKAGTKFLFTVTAVVPCDKPEPEACTKTDFQLTADQWKAFSTDEFLEAAIANFSKGGGKTGDDGFWTWFIDTYAGDSFGFSCDVEEDNNCGPMIQRCDLMKNTPWRRQAYLVIAAMLTLSQYLHYCYAAYAKSDGDLGDYIPSWVSKFLPPKSSSSWQSVIAVVASIIGIVSVIAFGAAPFLEGPAVAALGAGLFGVSSILNGAIQYANADGSVYTETLFLSYSEALESMNKFISHSQKILIDIHNEYFSKGTNLTKIFSGGAFINKDAITDLTADSQSGAITEAAKWFDRYSLWKITNTAWNASYSYVVHMPYGKVGWYDKDSTSDFTEKMCDEDFRGYDKYNDSVVVCCNCAPPGLEGMTVLTRADGPNTNSWGFKEYFDIQDFKIFEYTFDVRDVIRSSLASYYAHGFFYNASVEAIGASLTYGSAKPLQEWTDLKISDPGIFNLPVCEMSDIKYMPGCFISGTKKGNPAYCYTMPKICLEDGSNFKDPDTGKLQYFRDFIAVDMIDWFQHATTYLPLGGAKE